MIINQNHLVIILMTMNAKIRMKMF